MKKRYILLVLIVGFGAVFFALIHNAAAPVNPESSVPTRDSLEPEQPLAQKDDLIVVETPREGQVVGKTFVVKGKARGNWYFEGSFPITVKDAAGNVLVSTYATAQGEWMTTEYVPFTARVTLPEGSTNHRGFLILQKDNPSDNPALDNQLVLPLIFS